MSNEENSIIARVFTRTNVPKQWIFVALLSCFALILGLYLFRSNPLVPAQSPLASVASVVSISPVSPPETGKAAENAADDNYSRFYEAGLSYYDAKEYAQAIDSYNTALAIKPDYVDGLNARGNAYLAMGDVTQAMQDYNKAIEFDSSYGTAYYNRGRAKTFAKDYQGALVDFAYVITSTPRLAYDARVNRGVVYCYMRDYKLALQEYEAAIRADPNQANAYLNKATTLVASGDFSPSIAVYNSAIAIDSRLGSAYWGKGWAYYELKDYEASIEATKKAIDLIPGKAALYFNLGLAQLAGNHIEEAHASYQTGLQFAAGDEKKQAIAELEALKETMPERATDVEQLVKSLR